MKRSKRQNDFSNNDTSKKEGTAFKFSFDNFNSDDEDWSYYFQRFQIELSLHDITSEEVIKRLLLSKIGAKAFKVLADHFRPSTVVSKSYEEITEVLSSYYESSFCTLGKRVAFGRRFRQEGESVSEYLNALRS